MSTIEPDPTHPQSGDRLRVVIEGLAAGGDGVARANGFTLFVPHSAPGDVLEVIVTRVAKNYGTARIDTLVAPGADRVPTGCPLAGGCPGCQLQHLRYSAQLAAKQQFVTDALERIGRLRDVEVRSTLGMEDPWRYRNKGEFVAAPQDGGIRLGYTGDDGGGFVPLGDCPIQHPISMKILRAVEEVASTEGLPLAQLITRVSPSENTALAILVCWDAHDRLPAAANQLLQRVPELTGVLWSRVRGRSLVRRTLAEVLAGKEKLLQRLGPWEFTVSAESFFQVNTTMAEHLLTLAKEYAGELSQSIFADAYCGVGTFLIPLASRANRSLGIEEHPVAIEDAKENLARYAFHDVHLYNARVETIFPRLVRKGRQLDVVVLDPPRKGAGRVVLESLAALDARRVVLVSCDPATLGRDAGDLSALGYRLEVVQPVDMFPQTWHVETIALAEKR